MGEILQGRSPLAAASRMLLSIAATLFLLTAVAILMRPSADGDISEASIAGNLQPARVNLADVR